MSTYRYIKCSALGCEGKFSTYEAETDAEFIALAHSAGWTTDPARCTECNAPTTPETDEHPILVLPLASGGAFTAYCPRSMTPADWKAIQAVCGAMAGVDRATATDGGSGVEDA